MNLASDLSKWRQPILLSREPQGPFRRIPIEPTFNGKPTVTLLPGAPVLSDPVELKVAPLTHLAVSLYFEQRAEVRTYHLEAAQTAYISSLGNFVSAEKMPASDTATAAFF